MIDRYFGGEIPAYTGSVSEFDNSLLTVNKETVGRYEEAMEKMEFSVALTTVWQLISRSNKYIDETQPWVIAKDEERKPELESVMAHLAESLRRVAVMLQPFLTRSPKQIFDQLGVVDESLMSWDSLGQFGEIPAGTKVAKGNPLFPRLDLLEEVEFIKGEMKGTDMPEAQERKQEESIQEIPEAEEISIDEFMKVDLRVAEILKAEPVKKADKLLKLQLDLGYEKRQVVSGIAEYYKPEELIGRKVICVTNLKPVKLRGELSQGMILAGKSEGYLSLVSIDQNMPNGTQIK